MCRTKMAVDAAEPNSTPRRTRTTRTPARNSNNSPSLTSAPISDPSTSNVPSTNYSSGSSYRLDTSRATTSVSSRTSLSSLRDSLPENPHIYDFAEIRSATNNFLAKRYSSASTPSWRCNLRVKDVIVFQRKFRRRMEISELRERLSVICRSHHDTIIKLLGASIDGNHIYLVYEFVNGASLSDCLRNPRNPNFTVLSTWMSRMQIATDLAHGLEYIHNAGLKIDLVHKHIKSSSIIVTEPKFNAKFCHYGTAELCGEAAIEEKEIDRSPKKSQSNEIKEEKDAKSTPEVRSSDNRELQFEGVRGYMSPEFQSNGVATQKSDVFAFGVVILELLSGEEPMRFKFDRASGDYRRISVIETARHAIDGGGGVGEEVERRLRRWVDKRLKDSFPVGVAEKVTRVALDCVHVDPDKRPDMRRVAGKISKSYLESQSWSESVNIPTEITASFAPR